MTTIPALYYKDDIKREKKKRKEKMLERGIQTLMQQRHTQVSQCSIKATTPQELRLKRTPVQAQKAKQPDKEND